jgi:hypothetical protein
VLVLTRNGLPGAKHPLLQSAGLGVLNDGTFTASDANSITSLGMSKKNGPEGSAGECLGVCLNWWAMRAGGRRGAGT